MHLRERHLVDAASEENEEISSGFVLGETSLSGFEYNKVYELKELFPPAGYAVLNDSIYFKVVQDGTQTYLRLTDQNGELLTDEKGNPVLDNDSVSILEKELSISIKNEPGTPLPATGGPGTILMCLAGTVLAELSFFGMLLWYRRRKAR